MMRQPECPKRKKGEPNNWPLNVLIAIDQLGNAIAAGKPDVTISARVGEFAQRKKDRMWGYWKFLEGVINWAFKPINGDNHCACAYKDLERDDRDSEGNDIARFILSIFILISCPLIALFIAIGILIVPGWRYQKKK